MTSRIEQDASMARLEDLAVLAGDLGIRRQAVRDRLQQGGSGADVVTALTGLIDEMIIGRYRLAIRQASVEGQQHCCLVALGGYGRRELSPYSDIDIMILFRPEAGAAVTALSKQVLHDLWDLGFQVGHSVRTIADCIELAATDLTIRTSMMEARFLAGSPGLFDEFHRRYWRKVVSRHPDRFIDWKTAERQREYEKFGETVYLLEPNVKKSKGGLRDLHVLQWAGMARHQAGTIQELADRGILARQDYLALVDAREFLWRARAWLHFEAGMAQEILSFDEQVRLAARFGFEDRPHLLAVEQFMQQYYRHTTAVHEICSRFVARCRTVSWWKRVTRLWPASRVDGHFLVAGGSLSVPADARPHVLESPELLLRLFALSQSRKLTIDTHLLEDIHRQVDAIPTEAFRVPEVSRLFRTILSGPGPVAATLEAMHRAHLLEKIIPVFATVRGLMQFNQYHKYTVDEHSLLAVGAAEQLGRQEGLIGRVYRDIRRKDLLHLAVLLHDLGKGREEDHSEVGKTIAQDAAARLAFDEQETRTLVFLVHQHLLMAHTAFRRDPYDEKVLLTFARAVVTPEVLCKLLVLTAADISAVGPGMFTKWKESLLIELFLRTLPELSGEGETDEPVHRKRIADEVREAARREGLAGEGGLAPDWVESQLAFFPLRYLHGTPVERIAAHLRAIQRLQPSRALVEATFNESLGTCEYTVITVNGLTPGLFSKIAGVLAVKGLQVLDAQIITREDAVVLDTFQVADGDYHGAPSPARLDDVGDTIVRVLEGAESVEHLAGQHSRLPFARSVPAVRQPTEVQIDNETSDRFTIIDVFADDRQGLLYVITRAIFMLDLSVHGARISTRLDQVADVFYVTDRDGQKIGDHGRLENIRATVQSAIDTFLKETVGEQEGILTRRT